MAGIFGDKDEERCPHYAQFASHLVRWQFDIIYWLLFSFNLVVLFCASWAYMRSLDVLEKYSPRSPERRRVLRRCIIWCSGCVMISTVVVVMEVYTLLALQFCDGEDLMALYWSTWTMIQVGSLIAVIGIILALCHTIRDKKHPPWALALGTPVLVVAGCFHFFHDCIYKRVRNLKRSHGNVDGQGDDLSRSNTLDPESGNSDIIMDADLVGLAFDGSPIIRFTQVVPASLTDKMDILGHCQKGKPIVICRGDELKLVYGKNNGESGTDSGNDSGN